MNNFVCEMCESNANPQSKMWEEFCIYCNETLLIADLEVIRNQIKYYESVTA